MKSKTTRRPSFLAKPGGMGRRKEMAMLLPPKRSLAYHEQGVEVDEKRIEVDWRDGSGRGRSKLVKMWECGEESSKRGVRGDPGSDPFTTCTVATVWSDRMVQSQQLIQYFPAINHTITI